MPGVWSTDDLVEGGLASVSKFVGRLDDVEEDVEGKFGDQKELHFSDVEIIEAADDVTLEEGHYTCWVKQSNKKNSTDGRMVADWVEFAKAHDMGPLPSCFYGVLMEWDKATYEFGGDMNPGRAMIPVKLVEEGGKKKSASSKSKTKTPKKTAPTPPAEDDNEDGGSDVPEILAIAIHAAVGEDGATREMIRRAVQKKAALRTALTAAGGLDDVLSAMEDTLDEDEGTYTRVVDDAGGDEDPV